MAARRGMLADIPDFSIFHGAAKCTTHHRPGAKQLELVGGLMVSTLKLSKSAQKGCPWCAIFWEAFKRSVGTSKPADQDFIYWRHDGESFFEPWCTSAQSSPGKGEFKIQIYTDDLPGATSVHSHFPFKNYLNGQTDTEQTMSQIDYWRQQCSANHAQCSPVASWVNLPTRLIDVSSLADIKLVETSGRQGQYVCLTHRWGDQGMPIRTTTSSLDQLRQGIPLESLPPTFRDAALVTRRMGSKYLWIDSLCIIQDDDDDWERESALMAPIYKNGLLTIAAAWASGPRDGLFQTVPSVVVDSRNLELARYNLPFPVMVRRRLRYSVGHLRRDEEHGILDRLWVLQERLLSPRVVYFGFNEVAWECMAGSACECEPMLASYAVAEYSPREPFNPKAAYSLSTSAEHSASIVGQSPELWHHIVNAYTGLYFTARRDKFPALSGLASEIARMRPGDEYLAGLWRSTLMMDLLWRKRKGGDWQAAAFGKHYDLNNVFRGSDVGQAAFNNKIARQELKNREIRQQDAEKLAPSWSWASVNTQVEYEKELNSANMGLVDAEGAELLDANCAHRYGMGMLLHPTTASVTIRGKLAAVEAKSVKALPGEIMLYRDDHAMAFSAADNPAEVGLGGRLYCLLIAAGRVKTRLAMGRIYGLVLAEAGDGLGGKLFQRVGMFQETFTYGKEWCVFDGITGTVDVVIV
ncbi:HET domain-containing protein [Metarhizium guizhouense ARSEF 977]|uniref:HET domain-containing protein n=1 Tax=Metarhizium guizhouense (strain ARSEF 977) TaxID=1276136 RepID=A0A0B4GV08_METGA|nr:HET domain-containing protein [Metarhizium guizhouense ARSEF 977]